jgi:hypothetical protein
VTGEHNWTDPGIGYRWIKANVYGALLLAVLNLVLYAFGRGIAVDEAETSFIAKSLFVAIGTCLDAFAFAVYARLTGSVLARKLSDFPARTWILVHVLLGLASGACLAATQTGQLAVEADVDPDGMLGTVLTVLVFGLLVGAAVGSLEGVVLRKVARGVRRWIGYSTLGGFVLGLNLLVVLFWQEPGWRWALMSELGGVIVNLIAAVILLPAVRRLEQRPPAQYGGVPLAP